MRRLAFRCASSGVPLLLAATLAAGGCTQSPSPAPKVVSKSPGTGATAACLSNAGGTLQLACPAFPDTTPQKQPEWDYFAWNSFIAANWPALDPASHNNQRGFPDLTKNFAMAQPGDLLVWETFKEKRELFQPFFDPSTNTYTAQSTVPPGPWNQAVGYGPLDQNTHQPFDFPACATSKEHPSLSVLRTLRRLPQLAKSTLDGNGSTDPNSLDETVEVASESLESPSALCKGYTTDPCGPGITPDCNCVQGITVGPRVWKGNPTQAKRQPVRYEVKVNYDYYNYVQSQSNNYWIDQNAETAAKESNLRLPFRTSAKQQPNGAPQNVGVTQYSAQGCLKTDASVTPNSNLTPCPAGSIQVKTAWIPLTHGEDKTKYHTATAAVYRAQNDPQNPICLDYDPTVTYGLVGIHIIQRIHQGSGNGSASPQGGTYIFATWEHVDNDKAGFTYANYLPPQVSALLPHHPPVGFYPMMQNALPVQRRFPVLPGTQQANNAVWKAIQLANPNSVWLNYRLIGTQFIPIDLPQESPEVPPFPTALPNQDPMSIGQPTYLANSVIETNDGLQLFRGLPPQVYSASLTQNFYNNQQQIILPNNKKTLFDRDKHNLAFNGPKAFNMGGCMGCHGVSEVKGFSFSFILLEGQLGADVDTESDFNVPPLPGAPPPVHLPPKVHKREHPRKTAP